MGEPPSIPAYTPTPIRLLEKQKTNKTANFSSSATVVYHPTPIKELEKYAPQCLAGMYSPSLSTWAIPDVPSYSPVKPRSSSSTTPSSYEPGLPSVAPSYHTPSSPAHSLKRKKKIPPEEDLDNDSDEADEVKARSNSEAKRKKILALYKDLYHDDEEIGEKWKKKLDSQVSPKSSQSPVSNSRRISLPISPVRCNPYYLHSWLPRN